MQSSKPSFGTVLWYVRDRLGKFKPSHQRTLMEISRRRCIPESCSVVRSVPQSIFSAGNDRATENLTAQCNKRNKQQFQQKWILQELFWSNQFPFPCISLHSWLIRKHKKWVHIESCSHLCCKQNQNSYRKTATSKNRRIEYMSGDEGRKNPSLGQIFANNADGLVLPKMSLKNTSKLRTSSTQARLNQYW